MKTFQELKAVLTQELLDLEQPTGLPGTTQERRVKEQQIGRHCYQAEEDLSTPDLKTLKQALGLTDTRWRAYKAKFIDGSPPRAAHIAIEQETFTASLLSLIRPSLSHAALSRIERGDPGRV